jgi:hypothetical protein
MSPVEIALSIDGSRPLDVPAVTSKPSQQSLHRGADRKAGDDIAGPVSEQQDPGGYQTGADQA